MTIRTPAGTPRTHETRITRAQFIGLFSDDKWDTIKSHPSKKLKIQNSEFTPP